MGVASAGAGPAETELVAVAADIVAACAGIGLEVSVEDDELAVVVGVELHQEEADSS